MAASRLLAVLFVTALAACASGARDIEEAPQFERLLSTEGQQFTVPTTFYLRTKASDYTKCADDNGGANSQQLYQQTCKVTHRQRFHLIRVGAAGSMQYQIADSTNNCWTVQQRSRMAGASIVSWTCRATPNQIFELVDESRSEGEGGVHIRLPFSDKCLEVSHGNADNWVRFQQWDCDGSDAQLFRMRASLQD